MKGYPKLLDLKSTCRYSFRCPPWLDGRRFLWHEAAHHPDAWCCRLRRRRLWNAGNGRPPAPRGWCAAGNLASDWPLGTPTPLWDAPWESSGRCAARGPNAFWRSAWTGSPTPLAAVPRGGVPRRSRSTWDASPANVRSRWAAAAPRGMAPNWPAHASLRAWWRVAPPRPYGGCWLAITANPGAILSGGLPNTHAMPPGRHPSRSSATSTPVSCLMPRGSGQVMRTPPDPLGLVSRLGGPLTLGIFPTAMRMHRSAGGP
jgi:hypothetical protein